jgi:enterochelin esterase-like enzyme
MTTQSLESPTLLRVREQLAVGNKQQVLEQFWQEVQERGTPLIEHMEGHDDQSLVSYLYRGDQEVESVLIYSVFPSINWKTENQLEKVPGTDIWWKTSVAKNEIRALYYFWVNDKEEEDFQTRFSRGLHDPLNPHINIWPADPETGTHELVGSMLEMPQAEAQTLCEYDPQIPHGNVELHRILERGTDVSRRVYVYTPPGYSREDTPYDLLIMMDGWTYVHKVPTPTILDNLIASGQIPPMVAVLVDHQDRMVDLTCNDAFLRFLAEELLPWVRQNFNATDDPARVILGGSSLGGLFSMYAAFRYPELFGNVISQSGSYWWDPNGERCTDWLGRQMTQVERVPINIYLELGILEGPTMQKANRSMRDLLLEHGYPVQYHEVAGGHDYSCWRGTLTHGLLAVVGKK